MLTLGFSHIRNSIPAYSCLFSYIQKFVIGKDYQFSHNDKTIYAIILELRSLHGKTMSCNFIFEMINLHRRTKAESYLDDIYAIKDHASRSPKPIWWHRDP
jgi:hypothetical protein